MAATVMTVEFGTSHHYSSLEKILKLVVQFFEQIQKNNWTFRKLWQFGKE